MQKVLFSILEALFSAAYREPKILKTFKSLKNKQKDFSKMEKNCG